MGGNCDLLVDLVYLLIVDLFFVWFGLCLVLGVFVFFDIGKSIVVYFFDDFLDWVWWLLVVLIMFVLFVLVVCKIFGGYGLGD